jgi:hypothetical protein
MLLIFSAKAQMSRADQLKSLENSNSRVTGTVHGNAVDQDKTMTATTKSAARLFGTKDDLTSVITIIPSGSTVTVLGSDSTYYKVQFEETEGYILKRQAVIGSTSSAPKSSKEQESNNQASSQNNKPVVQQDENGRFSYLENKYGTAMAARLNAGKIWKGMNAEMVKDSWGSPQKINRIINGNTISEDWTYKSTRLYFENNTLVDWGPVRR